MNGLIIPFSIEQYGIAFLESGARPAFPLATCALPIGSIGSGAINYFLRNRDNATTLSGLLLTSIITRLSGLSADIRGVADGALAIGKMAPFELTHLFAGICSLLSYARLKNV